MPFLLLQKKKVQKGVGDLLGLIEVSGTIIKQGKANARIKPSLNLPTISIPEYLGLKDSLLESPLAGCLKEQADPERK